METKKIVLNWKCRKVQNARNNGSHFFLSVTFIVIDLNHDSKMDSFPNPQTHNFQFVKYIAETVVYRQAFCHLKSLLITAFYTPQ